MTPFLFEIAVRHLLGASPRVFVRARSGRLAAQGAVLAVAGFVALRSALAGHPVWGLFFAGTIWLVGTFAARAAMGPVPTEARGAYASAVTYVAVLGIAIAAAAVLVVISVMDGLQADIRESLLRTTPAVEGIAMGGELEEPGPLLERLRRLPGVTSAWERVDGMFLLVGGPGTHPIPVELRGIPIAAFDPAIRARPPEIVAGDLAEAYADPEGAIFGVELMHRLGLAIGDEVEVVSPARVITPFGLSPTVHRVRVDAAFRSGFYEIDANRIYASPGVARGLAALGDASATHIEIHLADASPAASQAAAESASEVSNIASEPVHFLPWMDVRRNLYIAMETEKMAMFLVESLLLLVGSFNITATLFMVVSRKTSEIAVLRVLGFSPRKILALFALEGTLLGAAGGALGLVLGWILCGYLDAFPLRIPGGGEVYYIADLPVRVSAGLFAATGGLVVSLAFLAALLPARTASRFRPAEVLRHG